MTENALMGLCPDCLLQAGLGTLDAGSHAAEKSSPFVPPTPEELARYFPELEIVELLGRGGMGAVYKVRQKRLERFVALKILPPGVGQAPAFAERFEREAKALAQLHHPNIVTLYDSGQVDGLFYFFMEFVDGVNLRQLLDTGHISPKEALAIVPQICDALQFAHDRGIIHCDIKPENILLNKEGRVKIADFGVAKIVARESLEIPTVRSNPPELGRTEAGRVIGTPQYMAPEQLSHPLDVDNRADIYALGVVFYQMLTGELPAGKFEPPSYKVQVDVRLDEVVLRALEKKPELRYQQASAIKTHLETIALNRAPVSSSTPSSATSRQPKRLVLAAGLAVGIFLLGALGATIFLQSIRHKSARFSAENPRAVIEAELLQARTVAAQQGREYEAGGGDELELLASKNKVEILEAELTGAPVKIAKARLLAAQQQFVIISNMYKAGVTPFTNYQKAKGEVTIAEAQLREVSPKPEASAATANGATNAVSMPPTTVPAIKSTATVSAAQPASTKYPVAVVATTDAPNKTPDEGRLYHAVVYQQAPNGGANYTYSALLATIVQFTITTPQRASGTFLPQETSDGGTSGPVSITKASYEAKDGAGAKDVTSIIAKMLKHNRLDVPVGNDVFGGDPAWLHVKQLRVDYTIEGKKHEALAGEGTTLRIPDSTNTPNLASGTDAQRALPPIGGFGQLFGQLGKVMEDQAKAMADQETTRGIPGQTNAPITAPTTNAQNAPVAKPHEDKEAGDKKYDDLFALPPAGSFGQRGAVMEIHATFSRQLKPSVAAVHYYSQYRGLRAGMEGGVTFGDEIAVYGLPSSFVEGSSWKGLVYPAGYMTFGWDTGSPIVELISTSHVEKQNHTLRMHCRRLSRLTNAFSKKFENFKAAVALHYGYYNFVKTHTPLRCTPAMEAGVTNSPWTVANLVEMIEG